MKGYTFPIDFLWHLCQKLIKHTFVGLFLDFLLCSIDLYGCSYVKTINIEFYNIEIKKYESSNFVLFQNCFDSSNVLHFCKIHNKLANTLKKKKPGIFDWYYTSGRKANV